MTVRFSVEQFAPAMDPDSRPMRILRLVRDGPLHASLVFSAMYNPDARKPGRERGKTFGALTMLRDAGYVTWRCNFITITDAGQRVLLEDEGTTAFWQFATPSFSGHGTASGCGAWSFCAVSSSLGRFRECWTKLFRRAFLPFRRF